jgi:ABC-type Fe3+-hydroxamate transport system substrate-binding protein
MKPLFFVLVAAVLLIACGNNSVETVGVKSVDSAAAAAPDTIKAAVVDTVAIKRPARVAGDTAR